MITERRICSTMTFLCVFSLSADKMFRSKDLSARIYLARGPGVLYFIYVQIKNGPNVPKSNFVDCFGNNCRETREIIASYLFQYNSYTYLFNLIFNLPIVF